MSFFMGGIMGIVFMIVFSALAIAIGALFIMGAAKIADIKERSFIKALLASLFITVTHTAVHWAVGSVFFFARFMVNPLVFLLGIPIAIFFIKSVYDTEWSLAVRTWFITYLMGAALAVIGYVLHLNHYLFRH
jgi:hypothetical protein